MRSTIDSQDRLRAGFSLVELAIAVAIIGVMAGIAVTFMRDGFGDMRAKGNARAISDLLGLARGEAIRTGDNHVVFFEMDALDNPLSGPGGGGAAALLIRDADGDGIIDSGEKVAAVYLDSTGSLAWGAAAAGPIAQAAPNDNPSSTFPPADADFLCCTFTKPNGNEARWVVFSPDGIPRSFTVSPFATGDLTSGGGGVYLTSGTRDYAVVLTPLGSPRVHVFQKGVDQWSN